MSTRRSFSLPSEVASRPRHLQPGSRPFGIALISVLALLSACSAQDASSEGSAAKRTTSGGTGASDGLPAETPDGPRTGDLAAAPVSPGLAAGAGASKPAAVPADPGGASMAGAVPGPAFAAPPAAAGAPAIAVDGETADVSHAEPMAGAALPSVPVEKPISTTPVTQPSASQLTAGIWDDNQNLERFLEYRSEHIGQAGHDGYLSFTEAEHVAASELHPLKAHDVLDISLVLDVTGSMGDEIRYLQTEFSALYRRIGEAHPNAEQRWSLVVYRDDGDDFVTRSFDFDTDPKPFQTALQAQAAGGGGDFPEASHAAFEAMNQLRWRSDESTARLAFWVADAPHHASAAGAMRKALENAQKQDIHLYPVASSGIDEPTELSMRSAAQLTGGRYIFLTNDSGIGGSHKEASIPCYYVTLLADAVERAVDAEMSGKRQEVDPSQVIRSVGKPEQGQCSLESGKSAWIY